MKTHRLTGMAQRVACVVVAVIMAAAMMCYGESRADSLLVQLRHSKDHPEKMHILERLADMDFGFSSELDYLKQLYSMTHGNTDEDRVFRSLAISHICRYYFNLDEYDSAMVWAKKIDGVKITPEAYSHYFDIKYYECSAYLEKGNVEKALGKALELQKQAQAMHSEDGEVTCYEMLGDVYLKAKVYKQAIDAYVAGFEILKKQDVRATYRFQLLTMILECSYDSGDKEVFSRYLKEMKRVFSYREIDRDQGSLYDRCLKLFYAYSLIDAVNENNHVAADYFYGKLKNCETIEDWFVEDRSTSAIAEYFTMNERYEDALEQLSKLDSSVVGTPYELSYKKASLYERMHNYPMAYDCFEQAYDSLEAAYNRSMLNEFSQFQEICHEQYAKRMQKEYQAERQQKKIKLSLAALIVSLVILVLFAVCVGRSGLLKKRLFNSEQRLRADEAVLLQRQSVLRGALERHRSNGRMKSMFLSRMSHEIRTPLNAIVGFSNLLVANAEVSDECNEYVDIIRANSDWLMVLINNILDLGRLGAQRVVFNYDKCDLMAILDNALAAYSASEVRTIIHSPQMYIEIETDALQLAKVFGHIYSNAYKFTKEGFVKTEVELRGDMVEVRVEDTGIGVPVEKQGLVFERFEKIDPFVPGTGLGLSISREILRNLGGIIYADKDYTNGFAVVVMLPIKHKPGQI